MGGRSIPTYAAQTKSEAIQYVLLGKSGLSRHPVTVKITSSNLVQRAKLCCGSLMLKRPTHNREKVVQFHPKAPRLARSLPARTGERKSEGMSIL